MMEKFYFYTHQNDGSISTMTYIGSNGPTLAKVRELRKLHPIGEIHYWQHPDGCLYQYPIAEDNRVNTYTKLRDGTWGIRSTNPKMVRGHTTRTTVTKKNGDTEAHDVYCFWHGRDNKGHVALCEIRDVEHDRIDPGDDDSHLPEGVRNRYG